jgi:hypothetical protein
MRILTILAALFVVLASCGRTDVGKALTIEPPPVEYEASQYALTVRGQAAGTYLMLVRRGDYDERPAFRLDLVARTGTGEAEAVDSSVVFLSRDGLVPLTTFRFLRAGTRFITTAANYKTEAVAVATYSTQGETQKLFPFGPGHYDSDQLTFLGRAFTLPEKMTREITVINPMGPPFGGNYYKARVTGAGSEVVQVPAGRFECSRLTFQLPTHSIDVWYEQAGFRRVIRYEDPSSGTTIELLPGTATPDRPQ